MAEKRAENLAIKIAGSLPVRGRLAIVSDTGQILYSSLSSEATEAALKIVRVGLPFWDVGDYQVKKLRGSHLLIYKITDHLAFALDSVEREGILILAAKRVASTFDSEFKELEGSLGGVSPIPKAEEITLSVPSKVEAKPEPVPPPSPLPQPASKPQPVSRPAVKAETVNIPVLTDKSILKKVKDKMARSILELCDGSRTTAEIAKKLNISRAKVLITLGEYSKAISYISGVRTKEE